MSRRLIDLDPSFRARACELIARCAESEVPVMIINTRRTAGRSLRDFGSLFCWVAHSKHEDGLAIDICPYEEYRSNGPDERNWDPAAPEWERIGNIGESLGLMWGGRWTKRDMGHFEAPDIHS